MTETLMFVLRLKETISGGMQKVASVSNSVFNGIDKRLATTQQKFSMVGKSVADLNTRLQLLTQKRDLLIDTKSIVKANREIQALELRMNQLQNKGRASTGGGGGIRVPWWISGAAIAGIAGMGLFSTIKNGAVGQRDIVGLQTFMGQSGALSYYNKLQDDARLTQFVTHDLMSATRMLISTGMSADAARKDIMNLANAIAATGGGNYALERMAQHLQMIRSMGHASYLQLKEFTTNGINIMQLLSDATGKHIKMAHGMTVSYDAIAFALQHAAEKGGLFYGALLAQSQTVLGKWSTLMDDIYRIQTSITMSQSKGITSVIDTLDGYVRMLPSLVERHSSAITVFINGVVHLIGVMVDLAKWLYHNWGWIKYVVGALLALKLAFAAVSMATTIYNTLMVAAQMRFTALAASAAEATVATEGLGAAMVAGPWALVALGIAGIGIALTALISKTKEATDANDQFNSSLGKTVVKPREATLADYRAGTAIAKPWGGYRWIGSDFMDAPFTAAEQKKYDSIVNLGRMGVYKRRAEDAIRQDRLLAAKNMQSQFVVNMPNAGMQSVATSNSPSRGMGADADGIGEGGHITGGGGKVINVNLNHALLEIKEQIFKGTTEGVKDIERKLDEAVLRVLQSFNAVR